jgi:hypothetical protein
MGINFDRLDGDTTTTWMLSLRNDVDDDGITNLTTQVVSAEDSPDSIAIPIGTNELVYADASDPMTVLVRLYPSQTAADAAHAGHAYVTSPEVVERLRNEARAYGIGPGMTYRSETEDADGAVLFYATMSNGRVDVNIDMSSTPGGTPYLEFQLNYPANDTSKLYTRMVVATDGDAGSTGAKDTGSNPAPIDATQLQDGPLTVAEPSS